MMNLLTFGYFFFRQKRILKIGLEQMFMSGSNISEVTDLKDVITSGNKRSPVIRLVCRPLLAISKKIWLSHDHTPTARPSISHFLGACFLGAQVQPDSAHSCCDKLTAVKTGYMVYLMTSIT